VRTKDNGIKSRKMWMAVACAALIFIGAGLAALFPAFAVSYSTFVGGEIAALAVYCGGNVGERVANRGQPAAAASE
jgi:hypothetical protein